MYRPNSPRESLCETHFLMNNLYCFNEAKPICVKCIPNHLNHKVDYLSNLIRKSPKNNYMTNMSNQYNLNYSPVRERSPNRDNSPNLRNISNRNLMYPNSSPVDLSKPFKNNYKFSYYPSQYIAIDPNNLNEIQNSYTDLQQKINIMLDSEIDNINQILRDKKPIIQAPLPPPKIVEPKPILRIRQNDNPIPRVDSQPNNPLANQNIEENKDTDNYFASINFDNRIFASYQEPLMILKLDKTLDGTIYFFDTVNLNGRKITTSPTVLISDSAIILCQGVILVTGGKNEMNIILRACNAIDINNGNTVTRGIMNVEKRNHTLGKLDETIIYSVGGFNSESGYLNTCERYIVNDNRWEILSPLSVGRQDISVCTFRQVYLYCFGGAIYENGVWKYQDTIERLHIVNYVLGWEGIQLRANKGWTPRAFVGLRQITQNDIMIFGGFDFNHLNSVLIFNVKDGIIVETTLKLRRPSSFIGRNTIVTEDELNIFAIGFPYKDVHRFSFSKKVWEYLEEGKWLP